jgi:hypothetical protein
MHCDTTQRRTAISPAAQYRKSFPDPSLMLLSSAVERRAAVRLANERKASERRGELDSLTAPTLSPHERIRAWEQIYALKLPRFTDHPLAGLIASRTGLTLEDIKAEQSRRRERAGG